MALDLVLLAWMMTAPIMLLLWFVQRVQGNAVIGDVGFCIGFGLVSIGYGLLAQGNPTRQILVAALGAIYALRLGGHVFVDRVLGKPEDPRYQGLRRRWGSRAQAYFFLYFQGQAVAVVVFSLPLLVLIVNPATTFSFWEWAGVLVWAVGIVGEAVADGQLVRFRTDPLNKGKTCRQGLWRYSRHPNYFFEGVHWCAYVVMSIGVAYGWITLVGPVFMIWALLKVSGVPFAEAQALASRGDDYREYQRTTNVFIPWFPRK